MGATYTVLTQDKKKEEEEKEGDHGDWVCAHIHRNATCTREGWITSTEILKRNPGKAVINFKGKPGLRLYMIGLFLMQGLLFRFFERNTHHSFQWQMPAGKSPGRIPGKFPRKYLRQYSIYNLVNILPSF